MDVRLKDILREINKVTETYASPDGTELLLLPYGARILGLFAPGSDENFYWTHPALVEIESARALFVSDGWHNSGGDRTWLTPELDIFFPDYPDISRHRPPRQLDAGDYQVTRTREGVRMEKELKILLARSKIEVELVLSKFVGPAYNPLRYERDMKEWVPPLHYAGYTQNTTLELRKGSTKGQVMVGLWNLIQMPHGGEIFIPTYCKTRPRILFGDPSPGDLVSGDRLVRFRILAPGEHKIAIRAVATTGRAGYLYPSGDQWGLVIRNFFVNPSGEYIDVPKDDPEDLGYAFHAVNLHGPLGRFCELEYHAPVPGQNSRGTRYEDTSQVWAFRGPGDAIRRVAKSLLSPEV